MRLAKPSPPKRKIMHSLVLGAVVASLALSGCTYLVNTKPRPEGYAPGATVDCTDDYAAVGWDVAGGTVTLLAAVGAFLVAPITNAQGASDEFTTAFWVAGGVGIAGSILYFVSASSNQVSECRKAKQDPPRLNSPPPSVVKQNPICEAALDYEARSKSAAGRARELLQRLAAEKRAECENRLLSP